MHLADLENSPQQHLRVAVTGATGFIGRALLAELARHGHQPQPVARTDLWNDLLLTQALQDSNAVVHLAGLAHRMGRDAPTATEFDRINRQLPQQVYGAAAAAGVRRFVHVSTIHVVSGNPGVLGPGAPLAPVGDYAEAKAAAEVGLRQLAVAGGPELVIVRPPLVYGPGVKGNLARLIRLCDNSLPLPFGSVKAPRSFVSVANLASALRFLLEQPAAAPAIHHPSDGADLSLVELVTAIRSALGRPARLLPLPVAVLRAGLQALAQGRLAGQLLDELRVDTSSLLDLGWRPPQVPRDAIEEMVRAWSGNTRCPLPSDVDGKGPAT